jgi:hypothetical protein
MRMDNFEALDEETARKFTGSIAKNDRRALLERNNSGY